MKRYWKLSLHFLHYQWREGLLLTLTLSILLGVGTLAAVNFFTSSVKQEMDNRASELLGADWLIESSQPLPYEIWDQKAQALNLKTAHTLEFMSMVSANNQLQLGAIKAVNAGYPLRGQLKVQGDSILKPGEVLLAPRLLPALNINIGDSLEIGVAKFKVVGVINHEPDAGLAFMAMAPRVLMNLDDVAQTQLLGFGSRVEYRFLVSGTKQAIEQFANEIKPQLTAQQEVTDNMSSRPELVRPIESLLNFLSLTALIIFLLAALAMSLATKTYAEKQTDSTAILRCLGATKADIRAAYLSSLMLLSVVVSLIACLIGYSVCQFFIMLAARVWGIILPAPNILDTFVLSLFTGIILVASFAWPWLLNLQRVSPLRVLQRQLQTPMISSYFIYGSMIIALCVLWSFYQPFLLMIYAWGAILITGSCFILLTYLFLKLVARLGKAIKMPWRLGLMQLRHAKGSSLMQVSVFAFALTIVFFFMLIRQDFINMWGDKFPPQTPNYFVINILPGQLLDVENFFASNQKSVPQFNPMVRARLAAINDREINLQDYPKGDAPNMLRRDLNLSYENILDNKSMVSVEEKMGKDLNLKVGDTLSFQAGPERFTVTIAEFRAVDWYSMRPNFYVISTPSVLAHFPTTYLGSFYLAKSEENFLNELAKQFPNLTLLDVDQIISDLQNLVSQALIIIETLFFLVCLAVCLMLWVIIRTQADTREYVSVILRTLGATKGQLLRGWLSEFAIIGLIAGFIAIIFAQILSALVAIFVFDMVLTIHGLAIVLAPMIGALLYAGLGFLMLQKLENKHVTDL
ncbi:MAG: FtsX-like permease family protein [Legionellales bacterium]|jgi:putative ABC transport system permease protein